MMKKEELIRAYYNNAQLAWWEEKGELENRISDLEAENASLGQALKYAMDHIADLEADLGGELDLNQQIESLLAENLDLIAQQQDDLLSRVVKIESMLEDTRWVGGAK